MGFEPTTTGITIRDSTAELQPPSAIGAPDRIRTCYPRLRRPVLYPDELRARSGSRRSGRGGGIRTPDILLPKQVRYQTALHPVTLAFAERHSQRRSNERELYGLRLMARWIPPARAAATPRASPA